VAALWGADDPFADGTRGGEVKQLTDAVGEIIALKDGNVLGYTDVFLEGRRNLVRTEETNLGNLSADANLWAARQVDLSTVISIKNGGGIRAEIGEVSGQPIPDLLPPGPDGAVSQLDIENSLRFNNALSLITLDAQNLLTMIENALRGVAPGATPGAFPQISGLRFSFDATRPAGDRVVSMVLVDEDGEILDTIVQDGALVGDPLRDYRIVTLNFLANGGDNYLGTSDTISGNEVTVQDRTDLLQAGIRSGEATFADNFSEQDALAEYLRTFHATPDQAFDLADTGRALDERIQNLGFRADEVVPAGIVLGGGNGADNLLGGDGDDTISGGNGADSLSGGRGDDMLSGGNGDDWLSGGTGMDTISGGNGADVIRGGKGDDVLTGGFGGDIFVVGLGEDAVLDFMRGDRLRLENSVTVESARFDRNVGGNLALDVEYTLSDGATVVLYDARIWPGTDPLGLFG
jgi:Ca2+-binding RTX toxin-like protein